MPLGLLARPLRAIAAYLALGAILAVGATGLHIGLHEGLHAAEDLSAGHASAAYQIEQPPCPICSVSRTWFAGLPDRSPTLNRQDLTDRVCLWSAPRPRHLRNLIHASRAPPLS